MTYQQYESVRAVISAEIDHLILALDLIDGDTDLEEGGDLEPSLGAYRPQDAYDGEFDDSDDEPSLGSLDRQDQRTWSYGGTRDLEIESVAKRRLADEYDAAQERGEVQAHGGARNFNVPKENFEPTAADLGLTRKDVHEARQIRDAEVARMGAIVDRIAGLSVPDENAYGRHDIVTTAFHGPNPGAGSAVRL